MKKQITLITGIFLGIVMQVFGQSPQAFKYQAVVRDNTGNVIANTKVSFQMSILQGSASGPVSYEETDTSTTNRFGLANLSIGMGAIVSGNMTSINWANGPYFIKIEFDPTGGNNYTLMGITQMLSVPYALYAQATGDTSMWQKNGSTIYYNKGTVGIGTNNPADSAKLQVTGYVLLDDTETNSTGLKRQLRIFSYGNVTNEPAISFEMGNYPGHLGGGYIASEGNIPTSGIAKDLVFAVPAGNQNPGTETECMRLSGSNGSLGIGTNAPTSKLQVVGLPVYANNAAAISGGLTAGAFYRTGGDPDVVCVVH